MGHTRNVYIDFVKGLLIYLVILGHIVPPFGYINNGTDNLLDPLFKGIYIFHMPLFLLISGYFFYGSLQKNVKIASFFKKRILLLLLPLFVWSLIFGLIQMPADIETFCAMSMESFKIYYWFIWAIILYSTIIFVLHKIKLCYPIVLLLTIVVVTLIPQKGVLYPILKSMYPFFVFGFILASINLKSSFISFLKKPVAIFLISIISAICYYFWGVEECVYIHPSDIHRVDILLFRLFSGIVCSVLFMQLVYLLYLKLKATKFFNFISKIGQETLAIYLIQCAVIAKILPQCEFQTPFFNYSLDIVVSILYLLIFYALTKITSRNKILALVLWGKQLEKGDFR